ncbi:MAG: hypothetical protein AAGD01_16610 [Acidobacteriota bacterium]
MSRLEIHRPEDLHSLLQESDRAFRDVVFQSLDLHGVADTLVQRGIQGAVLLGCTASAEELEHLVRAGALIFPRLPHVPYDTYRVHLYEPQELLAGYSSGGSGSDGHGKSLDGRIYQHFLDVGGARPHSLIDAMAQRLHDAAITDAIADYLRGQHVVGIMGGHGLSRHSEGYAAIARLARRLARGGFLLVSGGGPGAMEATHLGAWFAPRANEDLESALALLGEAPHFEPIDPWVDAALEVRRRFPLPADPAGRPQQGASLGIPTWHYGHEPSALFAPRIAKYFANSLREDGLVSVASGGLIFAPGSAGTIQEIFQDACQNHYLTEGFASPMLFYGEGYWSWNHPVFPLLSRLAAGRPYAQYLAITDSQDVILKRLQAFRDELTARRQAPASGEDHDH